MASVDAVVKIEGSVQPLLDALNGAATGVRKATINWMQAVSFHLAERAELNAPIKTGALRASMRPMPIYADSNGVHGGVEDLVPYAAKMHWASYNLGPKSAEQPKTIEGGVATSVGPKGLSNIGPGRLYITNVWAFHRQKYEKMLHDMIGDSLKGKDPIQRTGVLQAANFSTDTLTGVE